MDTGTIHGNAARDRTWYRPAVSIDTPDAGPDLWLTVGVCAVLDGRRRIVQTSGDGDVFAIHEFVDSALPVSRPLQRERRERSGSICSARVKG